MIELQRQEITKKTTHSELHLPPKISFPEMKPDDTLQIKSNRYRFTLKFCILIASREAGLPNVNEIASLTVIERVIIHAKRKEKKASKNC